MKHAEHIKDNANPKENGYQKDTACPKKNEYQKENGQQKENGRQNNSVLTAVGAQPQTVSININDCVISVPAGSTILEACRSVGIDVPTLCYLAGEMPDGSCRMCVVEVEGGYKNGLVSSCTEICKDGMKVFTDSDRVKESRRFVLDLLLSDHTLNCFACAKNGSCLLQRYCLAYGIDKTSFGSGRRSEGRGTDASNPFFEYDPERCILCTRCVRVCTKKQGRGAVGILGRGFDTRIGPGFCLSRADSDCESCGNCVSVCPTGALSAKENKCGYRAWEVGSVRTTCPHCGVGCQMDLLVKDNKVVGVNPADGPANGGLLCVKGKFGSYRFIGSPDRLTRPLIRRNGKLEPASWEEALDLITRTFTAIRQNHGSNTIAGFSCSRATNEENYLFQKMMRTVMATNHVDNCARVCHSASVHGLAMTLGSGAMTNPIRDITEDVDVILLVGSNPTEAHPVIGTRIRRAVSNGARLIVVDPRKIDLVSQAAIHLPIKPGTNVAFANGMIHIILREGLEDKDFIRTRTEGFDDLREIVRDYTPENTAEICGIPIADLEKAAVLYAKADKAPIIYCLGVTEHSTGTVGVMSLSNLAMAVGKLGRPGCGINPLRGQNNVQGACDMGCLPNTLPGYQSVSNPDVLHKFEEAWKVSLNPVPGLTATQVMERAGEGLIKGLYIFGEDPMVTDPDTRHVRNALQQIDFLVVHDLFLTETAKQADVVLPGVSYAEKEGTFTNTERRVQRVRKAVGPPGEARPEITVFSEIMSRMGCPQSYGSAAEVMAEIAGLTPSFAGISHRRLDDGETLQWPCSDQTGGGIDILHKEKFTRGLGLFYPAIYQPSRELPDGDYPFIMITGRMLYQYNAGAMTQRTEGIVRIQEESYAEVSYEDAAAMGILDGERIRISSRRGEIETTARVGDRVVVGQVFMTFHFPDGNVNWITNPVLDDIARIPEYKVCAVAISRINNKT